MPDARTMLPVYRFARIVGLHPLHFMQVDLTNHPGGSSVYCVKPIFQYTWQNSDAISREELSYAIADAEALLARHLGYPPGPKWIVADRVPYEPTIRTSLGHVITGGREALSAIEANVSVTYDDADGDGYDELATMVVATTVTDPAEIAVFYPNESGSYEWQVRPITVAISGGVATITCAREQLVLKNSLINMTPQVINGASTSFLSEVDVYRHYNDASVQVQFHQLQGGCSSCGWGLVGDNCEACGFQVETGCMTVLDHRLGLVRTSLGTWDAVTETYSSSYPQAFCGNPDYVKLWYKAGLTTMPIEWELTIARLALSRLDRPICACEGVSQAMEYWKEDLAVVSNTSSKQKFVQPLTDIERSNPFGTSRAGLDTFHRVREARVGVLPLNSGAR